MDDEGTYPGRQSANGDSAALLGAFVAAFRRGIQEEMAALRERHGGSEVPLRDGEPVGRDARGRSFYAFRCDSRGESVPVGTACSLRVGPRDWLVTVHEVEPGRLTVESGVPIDVSSADVALVLAPWFLYQGLIAALERLTVEGSSVGGWRCLASKNRCRRLRRCTLDHPGLNDSQRAAVQLCRESSVALVWGPPGTGKTTTLARIVAELTAEGKRVLVASTTNAALDQALARIVATEPAAATDGSVVRVGRSDAPTFGALLSDVVRRRNEALAREVEALGRKVGDAAALVERTREIAARIEPPAAQQSLFGPAEAAPAVLGLSRIAPPGVAASFERAAYQDKRAFADRRARRFDRLLGLLRQRLSATRDRLREGEVEVLARARVVLATLSQVYLSQVFLETGFDVVVVDEASMAVLPTLFFAACLGKERVVVVGDPRQLPPIVAAESSVARRTMARNIFDVRRENAEGRDRSVALLDTQYRMHPEIGGLVSDLFYDGRIRNAESTRERAALAGSAPYPGEALVLVDTASRTTCERDARTGSRLNRMTAELCVEFARGAAEMDGRSVAIITPYVAQSRLIRRLLAGKDLAAGSVECSTIHKFQGQERDIVIIDLVDTAPMRPGRLLSDGASSAALQLLNVSISRARGKLIVVADVPYFERHDPRSTVASLLQRLRSRGLQASWDEP